MRIPNACWITLTTGMALTACSGLAGLTEPPEAPPEERAGLPAAIDLVSGDDQTGKTQEYLGEPFVVRVTDEEGHGVRNAQVIWSLTSGGGDFFYPKDSWPPQTVTITDADGFSRVFFRPRVLGTSTATARVEGLPASPVSVTAEATVFQILAGWWYGIEFEPSAATIPAETPVEWVNLYDYSEPHTVTSNSVPPGAASFDSGPLNPGDRFRFVPDVAGTWEYFCDIHGAEQESGVLTVR